MTEPSASALLTDLLGLAGRPPADGADGIRVAFDGTDPVLPTRFPIGETGAAAIAAAALEAARIWQDRTGRAQTVRVPVDAAAAAMRSARYLAADPPSPAEQRRVGGLSTYRTADERWIYFQQLLPHHRERLAAVLGRPTDEDAMRRAVAGWRGEDLESAVVAAGATGSLVRSEAEWAAHAQAKALAELPLLEILRIGDADPEPIPLGARPLAGLRVLDATRILAGPTCGRTLAEHGADVLRVGTSTLADSEPMRRDTGHGKRSCDLDLKTAPGLAVLYRLVADADVFVQGYRPGAFERLGLSPEELVARRPGLVYVSLSAFGHVGPWRQRRGFDSVVQSASGLAHTGDSPDQAPVFLPANPLDYTTGYLAAFGALVALRRRASEGGSYLVRVSLAQTGRWLTSLPRYDAALAASRPAELAPERLQELMTARDTPFGRLRFLAPTAQLSHTPARWELPTVPLDHDEPSWPERVLAPAIG